MEEIPNFTELDILELPILMVKSVYDWEFSRSLNFEIPKLLIKYYVLYNFDNHRSCIVMSRVKECNRHDELKAYYEKCVTEVEEMRNFSVCDGFNLHELVTKILMPIELPFIMVFRETYKRVIGGEFPIYTDLIYDKIIEKAYLFANMRQDTSERRSVRHKWEAYSQIITDRIGPNVPYYDTDFSRIPVFRNTPPAFAMQQFYFMRLVKQLITHVVLFHFENCVFEQILKLHLYKNLPCYSFLLDCFHNCLSEVRIMRKDNTGHYFSLYRFLIGKDKRKRMRFLANTSRSERLYQRLIRGKYEQYRGFIADTIERSFFVDLLLDKCIFTEVYKNYNKTNPVTLKQETLIFLSQELTNKISQYLSQGDLVNLLLAFTNLYKIHKVVEKKILPQKRQMDAPIASCKRATHSQNNFQ